MNNYEWCTEWAKARGGKVLDYGCGAGELLAIMRSRGIDAYGCDVFYEGGDFTNIMVKEALPYISRMDGDRIPFDDASFDAVVSNQVLEHVPDLVTVCGEIARVLKPGGFSLNLFPYRGTLMEWHAMIPLLHLLPRNAFRTYWACAWSLLPGFGLPLRGETRLHRFRNKCVWVDNWTHYRTIQQLHAAFAPHFEVTHIDGEWLAARRSAANLFPRPLRQWLARRIIGIAVVLQKK